MNIGDKVIFKKNGREWNYGKITGNVNGRSYIIEDNINNFYRRNRRVIAKTNNNVITQGDIILEENNLNNLKEINIVPPMARRRNDENPEIPNQIEFDNEEAQNELTANISGDESFESALSSSFEHEPESNENTDDSSANHTGYYRTRSGRTVIPPKRYGFE